MIHELHYDNTNTYFIETDNRAILFDTGWAGSFLRLCRELGEKGLKLQSVQYLMISHFHPDHMGLAGELTQHEIVPVVMENQVSYIHAADEILKKDKRGGFVPIENANVKVLSFAESRAFLKSLGTEGEIIPTPGHSDDSISLCLDSGEVFVGDLYPFYELKSHEEETVWESWRAIMKRSPKKIYYGHAKSYVCNGTEAEHVLQYKKTTVCPTQKNSRIYKDVEKIIKYIDKGVSIDVIALKLKKDPQFVQDVCRMYLTHQNVGVQGILDRIEIKGR